MLRPPPTLARNSSGSNCVSALSKMTSKYAQKALEFRWSEPRASQEHSDRFGNYSDRLTCPQRILFHFTVSGRWIPGSSRLHIAATGTLCVASITQLEVA